MTENDIHKCLMSFGFYPFTLILKELEEQQRFEECDVILNAMNSYRNRFKIVTDDIPTKWSKEFEDEYFSYFKKLDSEGQLIARENVKWYLGEIRKRLEL